MDSFSAVLLALAMLAGLGLDLWNPLRVQHDVWLAELGLSRDEDR